MDALKPWETDKELRMAVLSVLSEDEGRQQQRGQRGGGGGGQEAEPGLGLRRGVARRPRHHGHGDGKDWLKCKR